MHEKLISIAFSILSSLHEKERQRKWRIFVLPVLRTRTNQEGTFLAKNWVKNYWFKSKKLRCRFFSFYSTEYLLLFYFN